MVSIIIPVYNCHDYTHMCIESIYRNTKNIEYEIIVVDNGSEQEQELFPYIDKPHHHVIRLPLNHGFPFAVNCGIGRATGEYICILNNDTIVSDGWLERMIGHLEIEQADIVGCMTNIISGKQVLPTRTYRDIEEFEVVAKEVAEKYKGRSKIYHRIVAFCMVIRKEVIHDIGLFSVDYGLGNFEDDDFCMRAIEADKKLVIAEDVFIHHFCSKTHEILNINPKQLFSKNEKLFYSKWSPEQYNQIIKEYYDFQGVA
jgi:GT2 family glycosyltransferase